MADSRPPAGATDDARLVRDEQLAQSTPAKGLWGKAKTQAAAPRTPVTMNGPSPTTSDAFPRIPTPPPVEVAMNAYRRMGAGERSDQEGSNHAKRQLPEYNAELPLFNVLFSWKGTVLPLVINRLAFWILWGSHGFFILLIKVGVFNSEDEDPEEAFVRTQPSLASISVPTSLTVFFLVSERWLNV